MFNAPEIKLLQGFCSLNFGASQEDAILIFGEPDEIQNINDDILNNSSLVAHYWDLGFSLFFDNHFNKRFVVSKLIIKNPYFMIVNYLP